MRSIFLAKRFQKHRCIAEATELFFEEVLMKKDGQIGLINTYIWDKFKDIQLGYS